MPTEANCDCEHDDKHNRRKDCIKQKAVMVRAQNRYGEPADQQRNPADDTDNREQQRGGKNWRRRHHESSLTGIRQAPT
jgi:hypothetical protein